MKFCKFSGIALIVLSVCLTTGWTARILCFFPSPSISHVIVHTSIARALVERGHNVTVVTTVPVKGNNPGFRHIHLNVPGFPRNFIKDVAKSQSEGIKFRIMLFKVLQVITDVSDAALRAPEFQKLMGEEFDLIVLGYFFNTFHLGLGAHFKCPVVISWMIQPSLFVNELIGNPPEIFYVPDVFLAEKQPLTFLGRVKNFLFYILDYALLWGHGLVMKSYYESHFPPDKYPSYDKVIENVSLILVNHHFTQGPIRPNVPALVEVGGIQIKENPDPLPEDIQRQLDDAADHGAVFFSLGSNFESSDLSSETQKIIYKVLSNLKQKVLWKWGNNTPPGNSSNILFRDWFPQDDVLTHPNLKLFITHGGKGSIVEAEYRGVPMIAIPFMADQLGNALQMGNAGFGITLEIQTVTEDSFRRAVLEVLDNPKYAENVKQFSKLYRDRPQSAKETATFWIEYVIRHSGASHMRSPYLDMNVLERTGLDIIVFLMAIVYIVIKVITIIIKFILRKIKPRKYKNKAKKLE